MTDCESRVQAFSVALREESYQQNVTQRGRDTLEAVLVEVLPKSQTATPAACESILSRLRNVTQNLAKINEIREPATTRLSDLTVALDPVTSPPVAPVQTSSNTMTWVLLAAAGVFFFLLARRKR